MGHFVGWLCWHMTRLALTRARRSLLSMQAMIKNKKGEDGERGTIIMCANVACVLSCSPPAAKESGRDSARSLSADGLPTHLVFL